MKPPMVGEACWVNWGAALYAYKGRVTHIGAKWATIELTTRGPGTVKKTKRLVADLVLYTPWGKQGGQSEWKVRGDKLHHSFRG